VSVLEGHAACRWLTLSGTDARVDETSEVSVMGYRELISPDRCALTRVIGNVLAAGDGTICA
jgi:hypothetical protein